jgi:hypothetical protein
LSNFDRASKSLSEIQALVREHHHNLQRTGRPEFDQGGCLVLGSHYARSPILFLGINPGLPPDWAGRATAEAQMHVEPCCSEPYNSPLINKGPVRGYWHNCGYFFNNCHDQLHDWTHRTPITSTFVVPWRTCNTAALHALNRATNEKLFKFSGDVLFRMIEHHDAKLLIVAGKHTPSMILEPVLNTYGNDRGITCRLPEVVHFEGPGRNHSWSDQLLEINGKEIRLLQVPHFTRVSYEELAVCASWLLQKLTKYGFMSRDL